MGRWGNANHYTFAEGMLTLTGFVSQNVNPVGWVSRTQATISPADHSVRYKNMLDSGPT